MFAKIKKALLVIFITCLIWVWADLSQDIPLAGQIVTVTASQANPNLWVSLENKPDVQVKVNLKGQAKKISEFSKKVEGEEGLRISFDVEKESMTSEGSYTLENLRRFLQDEIKKYGLTVVACDPEKLEVQVVKLIEKPLAVKCIDEVTGALMTKAKITPETVNMFVPAGKDTVEVKLNSMEKKQARQDFVEIKPHIDLGGRLRYAEKPVRIELPSVGEDLQPSTIRGTVGFLVSENWTGQYEVEWIKAPDIGSISILATPQAKAAYEAQLFEVILEIRDNDINAGEITRKIIYNFPQDFLRDDKIRLNGDPVETTFKLVPVKPPENGALE
jgi:hypothetical protein